MAKNKSCQNVCCPRVLSEVERALYGWSDEEVFSQPSMVTADVLPELRHKMRLMEGGVAEGDYVIEAAGPSDWLPFRAAEDMTHFLWVYTKLFTRLGVRRPFTDFQREVMTRCRVAASQLHLNGWGFLRTFERICLHFGFRPSCRIFLYIYQLHAPPPGKGFMSFRAHQGWKLFDAFDESIQEFKWHYFKLFQSLPAIDWGKNSLLKDMVKQSLFDCLSLKMVEAESVGSLSILPTPNFPATYAMAFASSPMIVVLLGPSFGAAKSKKVPLVASAEKPICLDREEGVKEDPSADLKQKSRKRKLHESFPKDAVLEDDVAWEHKNSVREALGPVLPKQLLRTAHRYACKLIACLQVGIENALSAKFKMEKELVAAKDQVAVLTVERDTTLTSPPLQAKMTVVVRGERLSALEQLSQVEEDSKVKAVELQSRRAALEEKWRKVEALTRSMEENQTALSTAEAAANH
ncbi:hypothetical protein PIB30_053672 [Stylosanthes scabra]|uniref:Transposase (Putative), gypsy type n=1 Tax=Stylosanthes scabra TaxID=79078 RepID=A0ABU6TIA9_9FABA|nr:hypothetical protein [Stylosanthes scabra]